jgi:hypothetical protein
VKGKNDLFGVGAGKLGREDVVMLVIRKTRNRTSYCSGALSALVHNTLASTT